MSLLKLLTLNTDNFWAALGSLGSIAVAYIALIPIREKAVLGKALFEDAMQIDVGRDGVFSLFNIFDEPIIIEKIDQGLLRGKSDFDLDKNADEDKIARCLKNLPTPNMKVSTPLNKRLAPNLSFVFAGTLTHLPEGMEEEAVWVVESKIYYSSTSGVKRECNFIHRFSKTLEPRHRWVELVIGSSDLK